MIHGRQRIGLITVMIDEYEPAIAFYTQTLGFALIADRPIARGERWVVVAPAGDHAGAALLLAKAATDAERASIGTQTGGRVFLFLSTDDFARDYADYRRRGVTFLEEPRHESYGIVAVFADLFGNRWDLIEPNT